MVHAGVKLYRRALAGAVFNPSVFPAFLPQSSTARAWTLGFRPWAFDPRLSTLGFRPSAFDPRLSTLGFRPWIALNFFCPMTPGCIWGLLNFRPKTSKL